MFIKILTVIFLNMFASSRNTGIINSVNSDWSSVTVHHVSALVGCQANVSLKSPSLEHG